MGTTNCDVHRRAHKESTHITRILSYHSTPYTQLELSTIVQHLCFSLESHSTFVTTVLLLMVCCHLVTTTSAAVITEALFSSGSGIEGAEGVEAFPCDICLDEILNRLTYNAPTPCNEVVRLTRCFEQCTPQVPEGEDNSSIRQLLMLTQTSEILSILKARNCEVYEEVAPGCSNSVLECLQPILPRTTGYPYQITRVECSDEALISVLQCTGNTPDCEWRSHIEMIASRGRRSVCRAEDKCLAGNLLFVAGPECKTYKMVDINYVVNLLTQPPMSTAPGTLFDTSTCRLGHASSVTC